ncbi:MAG: GNAT family N-acetyltransferase [Geodermatophilaceae bacterium]|jgi:aminoglycoside 2'-N-acetyltransferase I|nr:GNAT family N-acetyltransferase [Geodermatophilaceae bacterium]
MAAVRTAHTAQLSRDELRAIRELLDEAFDGDFTDQDFDHSLGGMHALVWEESRLVGHGSVVMRRLWHAGHALRTGYVEGVAVRADRRRHGYGDAVMARLEELIRYGYVLGALSSSEAALDFYAARSWQLWTGTASVVSPRGLERTKEEEGGIYVLPVSVALDPDGDLACDWRDGDVW